MPVVRLTQHQLERIDQMREAGQFGAASDVELEVAQCERLLRDLLCIVRNYAIDEVEAREPHRHYGDAAAVISLNDLVLACLKIQWHNPAEIIRRFLAPDSPPISTPIGFPDDRPLCVEVVSVNDQTGHKRQPRCIPVLDMNSIPEGGIPIVASAEDRRRAGLEVDDDAD